MLFSDGPSHCLIMLSEKQQFLCVSNVKTLHNSDINMLPVADLLTLLCFLTRRINTTFWTAVYYSFQTITCPCISSFKFSNTGTLFDLINIVCNFIQLNCHIKLSLHSGIPPHRFLEKPYHFCMCH